MRMQIIDLASQSKEEKKYDQIIEYPGQLLLLVAAAIVLILLVIECAHKSFCTLS